MIKTYLIWKSFSWCLGKYNSGVWWALHICPIWLQVLRWLLPGRQSISQTVPDVCPRTVPQCRWWSLLPKTWWEIHYHFFVWNICIDCVSKVIILIFFFFSKAFPAALAQRSPNVALLITSHGGHIGFLEGLFPRGEGYMDRVFSQFVRAVFEHQEDLKEACSNTDQ